MPTDTAVWRIAAARQGVLAIACRVIAESDLTQVQRLAVMAGLHRGGLTVSAADLGIES